MTCINCVLDRSDKNCLVLTEIDLVVNRMLRVLSMGILGTGGPFVKVDKHPMVSCRPGNISKRRL